MKAFVCVSKKLIEKGLNEILPLQKEIGPISAKCKRDGITVLSLLISNLWNENETTLKKFKNVKERNEFIFNILYPDGYFNKDDLHWKKFIEFMSKYHFKVPNEKIEINLYKKLILNMINIALDTLFLLKN